jgi:hypothetical protein
MRVADFVKAVVKAVRKPDHAPDSADGWIRTIHIIPLLGLKSLAGARGPIARIVKAGFAEEHRVRHNLFTYRLSPKFKTWTDAHDAARELERFIAPAGWVTLSQYARKLRRTVRGIQFRIDGHDIPVRVYKTPRPVKHYRRVDLDRLLG